MKILIAEDDAICNKVLTTILEMMTHEVVACSDGQQAFEIFQKDPKSFPIVISDWLMPNVNGLELCQQIRKLEDKQEYTYFILLTAKGDSKQTRMEAMRAEIDDFIPKPIDRDQLWMRLQVAQRILKYTKEITQLEKLLPICSYCKKIRDDNNYWEQVDTYLTDKVGTDFSHSICPDCYENIIKPQFLTPKPATPN